MCGSVIMNGDLRIRKGTEWNGGGGTPLGVGDAPPPRVTISDAANKSLAGLNILPMIKRIQAKKVPVTTMEMRCL